MDLDDRLLDLIERWEASDPKPTVPELARDCPELAGPLERALRGLAHVDDVVRGAGDAASGDEAPPDPGRLGGYRILGRIGEGGFGVVYRAVQESSGQVVALKVIRPERLTAGYRRRFRWEVQALARLNHPSVARIYDAGVARTPLGEQPFFAMELVEGEPLDRYAAARRPTPAARLELLAAVADAVHHAHSRGVVHRDLKPGNVLVTADGRPKVVDFGIAKATSGDGGAGAGPRRGTDATETLATGRHDLFGTLPYMAPEQVLGEAGDDLSPRTSTRSG